MKLKHIIKITVTVALLAFILTYLVDIDLVFDQVKKIDVRYFLLAVTLSIIGNIFCVKRWQLILKVKELKFRFVTLFKYYYIGIFYNSFFPGTVGGDSVKIYKMIKKTSGRKADIAASVVLDRLMGLMIIYFAAIVALVFQYDFFDKKISWALLLALLMIAVGFILLYKRDFFDFAMEEIRERFQKGEKVLSKIDVFYNSLNLFQLKKQGGAKLALIILLSISFFYISYVGVFYVLLKALGASVTYYYCMTFLPILNLIVMLPISIGGVGVREVLLIYFLSLDGVAAEIAVALGVLILSVRLINNLLGSLVNVLVSE